MNFLPELWNYIKNILIAFTFITVIAAGGWVAYIYDVSKKPQITNKLLIVEGDNALNIGRYADAKRIFETELKANPQNQQAAWCLEIAQDSGNIIAARNLKRLSTVFISKTRTTPM